MLTQRSLAKDSVRNAFLGFLMIVLLTNSQHYSVLLIMLNILAAYFIARAISSETILKANHGSRIFSFKLDRFCFTKMVGDHFHKEKPPKFWWFFLLYLVLL